MSSPALRVLTVAALSLFLCLWCLPDLARVAGHPNGDIGIRTNGTIVETVVSGSPAERAGIRPGDRIDLSHLSPLIGSALVGGYLPAPGPSVTIGLWHAGKFMPVTLRATRERTTSAYIVIREIAFLIPLAIGALLLLLRPGLITWGFFLFSLAAAGAPPSSVFASRVITDWQTQVALGFIQALILFTLPKTGLVLFAFALARRPLGLWPRAAILGVASIGVVQALPVLLNPEFAGNGWPALNVAVDLVAAAIALGGLFFAYSHVAPRLRQRLHWITAGFLVWIVIDVMDAFLWPGYEPYWFHTAIDATQVLFPLTVAYAIFRERVVDINFVMSRTLAYGLMTTGIVAVFALIDLFLSRTMEARFSLPVDIVVALGLGFFFHGMRKRVDEGLDRVVFRKRHIAEMRLAKAAKAVVHVDDPSAISTYLTQLPVEVLDLTGAALYMKREGKFVLDLCVGWRQEPAQVLSTSDPLVAFMSSELDCVRVSEVPMLERPSDRHDVPILAIPLVFRRELAGFALYGAHEDGADLDADDERALVPLVHNAAVTYDHLEAQALRQEIHALRSLKIASA